MAKFILKNYTPDQYYWILQANNGNNICWCEGYTTKQSAKDAIAFVKANAASAPIVDQTK